MQTHPGGQSPFKRTMCQHILQRNLNQWDDRKRGAPIAWPTAKEAEEWKWHHKPLKYSDPRAVIGPPLGILIAAIPAMKNWVKTARDSNADNILRARRDNVSLMQVTSSRSRQRPAIGVP